MLPRSSKVTNYRNVLDSTPIQVEDDVTCLVGKNEAGKSALLQALCRLNPAHPAPFDLKEQYSRWLLTQGRRRGKTDTARPIRATFTLEDADREAVEELIGPDVLRKQTITVWREYLGKTWYWVETDEAKAVANLLGRLDLSLKTRQVLRDAAGFPALQQAIRTRRDELQENPGQTKPPMNPGSSPALRSPVSSTTSTPPVRCGVRVLAQQLHPLAVDLLVVPGQLGQEPLQLLDLTVVVAGGRLGAGEPGQRLVAVAGQQQPYRRASRGAGARLRNRRQLGRVVLERARRGWAVTAAGHRTGRLLAAGRTMNRTARAYPISTNYR
jgi:hypothetical protein